MKTIKTSSIIVVCALALGAGCRSKPPSRVFAAPEEAVRALTDAVRTENVDALVTLFGAAGTNLIDTTDPAGAKRNRQIFLVAAAEGWRLVDSGADSRILVVGNENWPFPVPLVKGPNGWQFDGEAGREEVITRRVGRNELSAILACHTYKMAQDLYARRPHDGKRAGLFAATFRSEPGKENGLYWQPARHGKPSPLGELLAEAADPQRLRQAGDERPAPFHGYYFRILTAQGAAAPGGAKSYVVNGDLSGGHALLAWPARYDDTGVMTFMVGPDGVIHEKDLGPASDALAGRITSYDPESSWRRLQ